MESSFDANPTQFLENLSQPEDLKLNWSSDRTFLVGPGLIIGATKPPHSNFGNRLKSKYGLELKLHIWFRFETIKAQDDETMAKVNSVAGISSMMKIVEFCLRKYEGTAVLEFSSSDKPILLYNGNKLETNQEWDGWEKYAAVLDELKFPYELALLGNPLSR